MKEVIAKIEKTKDPRDFRVLKSLYSRYVLEAKDFKMNTAS